MHDDQLRHDLVAYSSLLYERGYAFGSSGNISVRLDNARILATPTGSSLGRLKEQELSLTDYSGKLLSGPPPSKEIAFHLALYADPECNCVIHLHATWTTLLSCQTPDSSKEVIRPFTPYYVMKVRNVVTIPYVAPGHPQLGKELGKWVGKCKVFLLQNHGSVIVGCSLEEAFNLVEEFEETAKLAWLMKGTETRYLSDDEITVLLKK